ncbi:NAD(P)-binding protein [Rhizodiscina lignyota]|uniref:NAD(P)-binding protein n=1 Tax=Rhizodiscina lignyota TaxID=1504668 RepID=A0A9P4M3Z6_9PEZI|nr:NAD(P)-binding protein [Rhizodiscina lignyota]
MASNSILFITGANTGLGFETIKALCHSSTAYTILLGGRNLQKAKTAAEAARREFPESRSIITPVQIDIEDDDSIREVFDRSQLDQQFKNGTMSMRDMWNKSWSVNTTGTFILTHTFVPLLLKAVDPRLLFITSGTSTLAESGNTALPVNKPLAKGWPKQSLGIPAYRSAKTGMNMMMRQWVRILGEDGVKVWCISPGYLATGLGGSLEMNKKMGAQDPTIGAHFIRDVVEGARDQDVGKVIRKNDIQPW